VSGDLKCNLLADSFSPNQGVAIGIGLNLSAVNKILLQIDIFFIRQKLKNGGGIHDTNEVIWRDIFLQIYLLAKLAQGILNAQKKPLLGNGCVVTPFYLREVFFCCFREDFGTVSAESSGEDGTIAKKRQRSPLCPDFHR